LSASTAAPAIFKERDLGDRALAPQFFRRCTCVRPNAEMKVPGTEVHRQVAVEVAELGGVLKAHLKDSALDTRTHDNMLPVMLNEVFAKGLHRLFCRLKVTQDSCRAVELFNRLLPQQFCLGSGGHRLLLRGERSLVIGGRS